MASANHQRFHIRSLEQLAQEVQRLDLQLPTTTDLSVLATPVVIGTRTAPNRFLVQPMEGFDAGPDGGPGPLSFRRYKRYAAGGYGSIWMEACAVLPEARSNPRQLHLHAGSVESFARLVAETRRTAREAFGWDIVMIIQLTHSGRYSKPAGYPEPIIAHHSPVLDPIHDLGADYPLVTDDALDRLQDTYLAAARLAAQAGFDGIDVKSCHRYLVSELLASFTREGRYGGSFENRTRLLRESLEKIHRALPRVFVTTRMNAYDAIRHPYGFGVDRNDHRVPDLREPVELAKALRKAGAPVLNVSIGNPYFNPHVGRPYDFPVHGANVPDEHPLIGLARFVSVTRSMQTAVPDIAVVASGYSWLRQFMPNVAAAVIREGGATLFGLGRSSFAYPDGPRDILRLGHMEPDKCCVACSACTQIMRDGAMTGCVVRDSTVYGPQYRLGRRFAFDRLREEARRCRDCENATCTRGCPARVDIPRFLKAFADNDIRKAYEILHASNVLPEMCGYVCPSDVQCEGSCLEEIFCEKPLPIRDIQLVTCQIARRKGWVGVQLPGTSTGRRVAVVGGGPAGIAGAVRLLEQGHSVSLFEYQRGMGGTPDSVIPPERYDEAETEVQAILRPALENRRLVLHYGQELGGNLHLADLRTQFDAVLIAVGISKSQSLGKADGVVDALEFLRNVKRGALARVPDRVAVIGGGNTAMDAAVTAQRLGAGAVYLVYRRSFQEMPAWAAERDHAVKCGVHILVLTQPLEYLKDASDKLIGLKVARTALGAPDASGRRKPVLLAGSEHVLPVDLVVDAIGQEVSDTVRAELTEVGFTPNGLIRTVTPGSPATRLPNVFVAGDIVNGGTTAVQGVAEGMKAAEHIDRFLRDTPKTT